MTASSLRSYAGIGSRETPPEILPQMRAIAAALARRGWLLRSGGAPGADTAFAEGARAANGQSEIYLPWRGFGDGEGIDASRLPTANAAEALAATLHPAWNRLAPAVRKLMARNTTQVLGATLDDPVRFVLCWARDWREDDAGRIHTVAGGTGQAVRLAYARGIPVFHLAHPAHAARFARLLDARGA